MFRKINFRNKGIVLYTVLMALLMVLIFATIILSIIISQSRLTHHSVSRIQAYYAAFAGANLAIDRLMANDPLWPAAGSYTRTLCRSACNYNDASLPLSVNQINITVGVPNSGINNTRTITVTADYAPLP